MRKRWICLVVIAAVGFMLTGCGTEMISVTEEEADTIAAYSAHVISKYNKKAEDGLTTPTEEEEEAQEESEETTQETSQETSQEEKETADPSTEGDDSSGISTQEETQTDEDSEEIAEDSSLETTTLENALGIDGITFTYKGYEVKKSVEEGSYFSTEPSSPDKRFVQVTFNAKASKKVELDTLSIGPRFRLTINDSTTTLSQATLLESDLSTYSGTIKAGKSQKVMLLFEVDKSVAKSIESMYLTVTVEDTAKKVELE
ncbi:hypothetical protein [Eubacterium oxidoreducens]|nr:hypothetical protein [Eubacterium oxidoreducens]